MLQRTQFLLCIVFLLGCGQEPMPTVPKADGQDDTLHYQIGFGGADVEKPRHLSFSITAVHKNQQPTTEAPFHQDGGDWTFFECQAVEDLNVTFEVGVMSKRVEGEFPVAWGRAIFIVKDRVAGQKFLTLFGKSFSGTMPPSKENSYEPQPLKISTAVLGEGLQQESEGGFTGKKGNWTATKWFPEFDGRSGEIFFNYNLSERKGEFSEKDPDYAEDLLALFSRALRDGPRPERTPENDPNLTLIGPKIGPPRKLLSENSSFYSISPQDKFAVYQSGSTVLALPLDIPDGKTFEIALFDNPPWAIRVVTEDLDLLVQEVIPESPGAKSSADPMKIWWVEKRGQQKTLLRGPEKYLDISEVPVSPDLQYVGLEQWRGKPGTDERSKVLFLLDRKSGTEKLFRVQGEALAHVGWKHTETGFQAIAITNRWGFEEKESKSYLADPVTGELKLQKEVDPRFEIENLLSPDKKRRGRLDEDKLIVTELSSGEQSQFVFHEDDLQFVGEDCIEWVSPRYLKFNGDRLALIDVTTMKMCYPPSTDGMKLGSYLYQFTSDLRWVLYQASGIDEEEGLFLAPVEVPDEQ